MAGTLVCVVGVFQECCDPPTCSRESNATTVLYARMGGCPTLSFLDSISHIPALLWALLLRSLLDVCATPPSAEGGFVRRTLAHLRNARLRQTPTTGHSFFCLCNCVK